MSKAEWSSKGEKAGSVMWSALSATSSECGPGPASGALQSSDSSPVRGDRINLASDEIPPSAGIPRSHETAAVYEAFPQCRVLGWLFLYNHKIIIVVCQALPLLLSLVLPHVILRTTLRDRYYYPFPLSRKWLQIHPSCPASKWWDLNSLSDFKAHAAHCWTAYSAPAQPQAGTDARKRHCCFHLSQMPVHLQWPFFSIPIINHSGTYMGQVPTAHVWPQQPAAHGGLPASPLATSVQALSLKINWSG